VNCLCLKIAATPGCGAATALSALHDILGLQLDSDKHKPPFDKQVFLGVHCDTSHVTDSIPYVEFSPSAGRTDPVNEMLYNTSKQGLDQHTTQVVKGKIGFTLQSAWGQVARADTQPLVSRCGKKQFLLPGCVQPPPEGTSRLSAPSTPPVVPGLTC